jgi:hypothetical protein
VEPLLVPILSLWILLDPGPVDLASGDAHEPPAIESVSVAPPKADDGDADADGVTDTLDACDGTPLGYPVFSNGCTIDTDGDGVPDGRDRCPATAPETLQVDPNGCSQRDRKSDRPYRYALGVA